MCAWTSNAEIGAKANGGEVILFENINIDVHLHVQNESTHSYACIYGHERVNVCTYTLIHYK